MSVTDTNCLADKTITNSNVTGADGATDGRVSTSNTHLDLKNMSTEQLEAYERSLVAMLGGPVSEKTRERRRRHSVALRDGRLCGKCAKPFPEGRPIYLTALVLGHSWQGWRTPVCEECAPGYMKGEGRFYDPYRDRCHQAPCDSCGRPLVWKATGRDWHRRHVFCCSRCQWTYYNGVRNERNAQAREKVCEVCEESFTASRRDAKTCSPACKQKAYRRRRRVA